jgi:DNA-binding response OmpR family regulator
MTAPFAPRRATSATLLVAEPDPLVRELLTAGLELHQPAWRVESAASAEEAADRLAGSPTVDLLILELALPDAPRGVALVQQVRKRPLRLPVLVLTAVPEVAFRRGLDVDAMLVKPPDIAQLLPRVDRLLAANHGSVVRGIALATVLQMIEVEKMDCTLTVATAGENGRVWLRRGRLAGVETRRRRGREALFEMLDWPLPVIDVVDRCDRPSGTEQSLQELLLEHAIAKDHGQRA